MAETSQFGVDQFRPFVDRFLQQLSGAQLLLIRDGRPDNTITVRLVELLLDMVVYLIDCHSANLTANTKISEDHVASTMGNAVPEAFAEALGTDTADPDISSQSLIKIMSEEISKSVNSAITTSRDAESRLMSHVTPSCRLNDMVEHAQSMMQSFIRKTTSLACLHLKSSPEDLELVDIEDDDHDESCSSLPVQVESSETDLKQSVDSSESRKFQVWKIVSKEMATILYILLDDASDAEIDVLLRDMHQESDSVVSDISESAGAAVRADKPKITLLLAKPYAKQLIHRAARKLKKIFSPNSKVKSSESLQSFAESVSELLRPEGGEKHPADEERQLERLQHIAEGRDLVFTEALRSLLSEYTIDGMTPESFCQLGPFRNTQAIRRATCSTVWRFQVLLRWWLTYQAGIHCDNVMMALNATEPTSPAPAVTVPETGAELVLHLPPDQGSEINRFSVRLLVNKLVTRVCKKAKIHVRSEDLYVIVDHLSSRIWAEVEGADFEISPATFERLDKAVFKDLCKSWGCAELVFLRMNRGEQEIDYVASTFKHHLMKPPKE
ncbi:hypothetical protein ABVT39_021196 [Epinephelus coioides]